jgi:hypothetical protein
MADATTSTLTVHAVSAGRDQCNHALRACIEMLPYLGSAQGLQWHKRAWQGHRGLLAAHVMACARLPPLLSIRGVIELEAGRWKQMQS